METKAHEPNLQKPVHGQPVPTEGTLLGQRQADERRQAVLEALEVLTSVSRGLYVPEKGHASVARQWRLV